jgi:hypothetical protein
MKNLPATELLDQRLEFLKRLPDQVRAEFVKHANFNGFPYDEFTRRWLEFAEHRYGVKVVVDDNHTIIVSVGDKAAQRFSCFEDALKTIKFHVISEHLSGTAGWYTVYYKDHNGVTSKKSIFANSEEQAFRTIGLVYGDVVSVKPDSTFLG